MNRHDFRTLYEHNDWANDRLLQMLTQAFGEETDLFAADDPTVRIIQRTTTHLVAALAVWRSRWEGFSPKVMLDPAEYPTPLALRMAFGAERARFWGFFETLSTDEALDRIVHSTNTLGEPRDLPLTQMMQHVLLHSAYHRGQITSLLHLLGHTDTHQDTDFLFFALEQEKEKILV
jgi:uncharacterized damage-inducible protein DinB